MPSSKAALRGLTDNRLVPGAQVKSKFPRLWASISGYWSTRNVKRRHHPMPMEDSFDPDYPLPLFLADRPERQSIGKACDRAVVSSRVFKALIAAATATGIVVLSVGDHPRTLFADVTASLVGNSGLQTDTDHPESTIQSTADAQALVQSAADAQALPPTSKDAPSG